MSRIVTKPTKWHVHPAKTQISLGIRPVWTESSLCAYWVAKDHSFLQADSEDSDQTGRMPRLIWVFAGRTCHFVSFVTMRLIWLSYLSNTIMTRIRHYCWRNVVGVTIHLKQMKRQWSGIDAIKFLPQTPYWKEKKKKKKKNKIKKKKTKKKNETAQAESQQVSSIPANVHQASLNKMNQLMRLWHFSSSVKSFFKRTCADIQLG